MRFGVVPAMDARGPRARRCCCTASAYRPGVKASRDVRTCVPTADTGGRPKVHVQVGPTGVEIPPAYRIAEVAPGAALADIAERPVAVVR
jgi:hypothetical protein